MGLGGVGRDLGGWVNLAVGARQFKTQAIAVFQ